MLFLKDPGLPPKAAQGLARYQARVDSAGAYPQRVTAASRFFEQYNRASDPVFSAVRKRLDTMCPGARRCCYCEDSEAHEIEHIWPKSLYPERTFVWENYLYACGVCNRRKGVRFSVMNGSRPEKVARSRNDPVVPPRSGRPALIDPRVEDPLDFLDLEIEDTFMFEPRPGLSATDGARAIYTIETLALNRDALLDAREEAFRDYRARIVHYREVRDSGAGETELETMSAAIVSKDHPTVWREMKRQRDLIVELKALFDAVPEALDW